MISLSKILARSIAGTLITGAALAATGCSTMCKPGRCCAGKSSMSQPKCGACQAKYGTLPTGA